MLSRSFAMMPSRPCSQDFCLTDRSALYRLQVDDILRLREARPKLFSRTYLQLRQQRLYRAAWQRELSARGSHSGQFSPRELLP